MIPDPGTHADPCGHFSFVMPYLDPQPALDYFSFPFSYFLLIDVRIFKFRWSSHPYDFSLLSEKDLISLPYLIQIALFSGFILVDQNTGNQTTHLIWILILNWRKKSWNDNFLRYFWRENAGTAIWFLFEDLQYTSPCAPL